MELYIGLETDAGLTDCAVVTEANVHDKHPLLQLLGCQVEEVYGDSAYASQQELIASTALNARDLANQHVRVGWAGAELVQLLNKSESCVRLRVEYVLAVVKRL